MDINAIARPMNSEQGAYPFALDRDKTVALIRSLADRIESGETLVQSVRILGLASQDDFLCESLRIVTTQRTSPPPAGA